MKGGRKRNHIKFKLERVSMVPAKFIRYLRIIIDGKIRFGKHIEAVSHKVEMKLARLTRLMPIIGGPVGVVCRCNMGQIYAISQKKKTAPTCLAGGLNI